MIQFAEPKAFYLLFVLLPYIGWWIWQTFYHGGMESAMLHAETDRVKRLPQTYKRYLLHMPFFLRVAALTMIVVALARPQTSDALHSETVEGIDIVMAVDVSTSMLAEDLKPNRLEASKNVATSFISDRKNDNIGLVIFAGEGFTQCPLTTNHAVLIDLLQKTHSGLIEDGTAIGSGLAIAVNRLRESEAVSKVVILLTDGSNNMGDIAPQTAAEMAKLYNIRIYSIGIGTRGTAPYPVQTNFGIRYQQIAVDIDEPTLQRIAEITGGKYFRATDNATLKAIYEEIDQMEKSKLSVTDYSKQNDMFEPWLWAAFILIVVEFIVRYVILRKIP